MIRIIAGRYRGKKLPVPNAKGLRPTTDRTRAAMVNLFMHRLSIPFEEMHVLDAYAGSGALGLECLSRGAASVTLVEKNPKVVRHLESVSQSFDGEIKVLRDDFERFLSRDTSSFDLVLLDPPFHTTDYQALLDCLARSKCVRVDTLVVMERPTEISLSMPREFAVLADRAYGRSSILVAAYRNESHESSTLPRNI